ncbi:unnamed protein product [marine sediment metagenome]|uniref:Uncharacterized protein n=1 Tax=marine sediment metagenome TaxID=412755 RepID=X1RDU8_9ZZZZ
MSEKQKTQKAPTCLGCKYYHVRPVVSFKTDKDVWYCINPHKGCEQKQRFFEGLVAELQKRKIGYITMNKACADNVTEMKNLVDPETLNKAEEYLQIIAKLYARASELDWVLARLGEKETKP